MYGGSTPATPRTARRRRASSAAKVAARDPSQASPWLAGMLSRKPRMLVTVALANKMARIVWALLLKQENYKAPVAAKA